MFSMPASAELFLNCSSLGNCKGSILVVLDLAKYMQYFSGVWCEMASFKLKNKSESFSRCEGNGSSGQAAATKGARRHRLHPSAAASWGGDASRIPYPAGQWYPAHRREEAPCRQTGRISLQFCVCSQAFPSAETHSSELPSRPVALPLCLLSLLTSFTSFLLLRASFPFYCLFYTRTQKNAVNSHPQNWFGKKDFRAKPERSTNSRTQSTSLCGPCTRGRQKYQFPIATFQKVFFCLRNKVCSPACFSFLLMLL